MIKRSTELHDDQPVWRGPRNDTVAATAARVAVLFGRQAEADGRTIDEIATDACQVARLAHLIRRAVKAGGSPDVRMIELQKVADRYVARTVPLLEKDGCTVALRFRTGLFSGPRNLFR